MTVTAELSAFVTETPSVAVPREARSQAVRAITDTLATVAAGRVEDATGVVWRTASASDGRCRVVTDSDRLVDPETAALVNGVAAHALDFDVISFAVSGFIGSALTVSLGALTEDLADDRSGADVITAYCLGWEAAAALGRGINPLHYAKGWHPTSTLSLFASTFGASRLLGLTAHETAMAVGAAVSMASGVKTMIGNMANPLHVGNAARNGVLAARLAAAGFEAHPAALEADQGFLNLFNGPDGYDASAITDLLGDPWDQVEPGPIYKIYPCCGLIHSGLDAILALRAEHGFALADVSEVRVLVHEYVPRVMHVTTPQTGYAAKFSIPYCVAASVRDGAVNLATFDGVDPDLVEWSSRVTVEVHPDLQGGDTFLGREFTEVEIVAGGNRLSRRVMRLDNRGTAEITDQDLTEKVTDCLRHGGATKPRDAAADLMTRISTLDGPHAVRGLVLPVE